MVTSMRVKVRAVALALLFVAASLLSTSCGSNGPASASPLPQGTSGGSSGQQGSSGSSCSDPCSSSSGSYSDITTVFFPRRVGPLRFADAFPGGDFSAQVNAAIADLPQEGGIVDARNFSGSQQVSSSIVLNKDVRLLLPPVHILITGAPLVIFAADGSQLVGAGSERCELQRTDPGDVIATDTSHRTANFLIENLTVGGMTQSTLKSAAINMENAVRPSIENVIVHGGYYGIRFSGTLWINLRNFIIDTSAVDGLYFEERQNNVFPSTLGGYVANGQIENTQGNGLHLHGFVDRLAFLQVDSEVNQGTGFLIDSNGKGIDYGKGGFERFFSCAAANDKGGGFNVKSNNNKFFDVYAETGVGPGIVVSGAANDFMVAEANGFSGGGVVVSGPNNRFYSITVNNSSDALDFLPGSRDSSVFGGSLLDNSGVGIDVQDEGISLYNVKQAHSAQGNLEITGTIARAFGNDGIPDIIGKNVTLGEGGPVILQGSSPTPPPLPCTPGSRYLVTVPAASNLYVCQGTPTPAWVAK